MDDSVYNMPYIKYIPFRHIWHYELPDIMRSNIRVISINGDEPIIATWAIEYVKFLIKDGVSKVIFCFAKLKHILATHYEDLRNVFDQGRPIVQKIASHKVILLATLPPRCKNFGDILKSNYFSVWKEAIFKQFDNNAQIFTLSMPFLAEDLPPDSKVLRSLLTPQIKPDEFHKNLYNF